MAQRRILANAMLPVLVSDSGPVRTLTLNRPTHRNALTPAMQQQLIDALADAAASPHVRVLILTGAGEAFCSGLDLAALKDLVHVAESGSAPAFELADDAHRFARILRLLYELPIPTIAQVNGHAIAGGTGLATVCDFTLAVPHAKFGYSEVKIGFVPALVSAFLALQVGDKHARNLLLTGAVFTAEQAHALGLVTEIVSPDALTARVQALAETLIANSPASLRATKALLADQNRTWLDQAINLALEASAAARLTADFREGVTAFLEKRKPTWTP
jgi:methylglutaconyl-CoA hydratase